MTILDKIVEYKKQFVADRKKKISIDELKSTEYYKRTCYSFSEHITSDKKTGIIAEFKRQSPSKGIINDSATVEEVTQAYAENGASALSVLTDVNYFGGSDEDLLAARKVNSIPILRKEFIIDPYQIHRAKSIGADVILLIAACLSTDENKMLAETAKELGLEVLLEIHNHDELKYINEFVDVVGVNNRNLKTFEVSIQTSKDLSKEISNDVVKISESGISSVESIIELKKYGFEGFLIGENFMKQSQPGVAFEKFVQELRLKAQ
jgi:indole-3-glycerol phosphate synthase